MNNFINTENFFTLDVLNERINCFNHASDSNVPPPLQSKSIKKELIILSASEMHYLVKNLCLFVGDLIKSSNKYWQLYLIIRKIVCIAMADAINEEIIKNFEKLVFQYLTSYKQLFKCNFKFKHHILLHYPWIMRAFGPLKNMSSMRYEAKHKQIKETSKIFTSRKNPSYSLAV